MSWNIIEACNRRMWSSLRIMVLWGGNNWVELCRKSRTWLLRWAERACRQRMQHAPAPFTLGELKGGPCRYGTEALECVGRKTHIHKYWMGRSITWPDLLLKISPCLRWAGRLIDGGGGGVGIGAMSYQDKRWCLLGYDNVIEKTTDPLLKNLSYITSPFIYLFSLSLSVSHTHTHTHTHTAPSFTLCLLLLLVL